MVTYLVLNCLFIASFVLAVRYFGKLPFNKTTLATIIILVLCTALFDPVMVALGLFYYAPDKILGITIGEAPIEDLLYAVLAGIAVPTIWMSLGRQEKDRIDATKS